jgi:phospho-N-acetylmuramoyl-pentapeptide-transferase
MYYPIQSSIHAILIAFAINIISFPIIIPYLQKLKFGQNVRDDGPKSHLVKIGTPTMGGIMILISFIITSLFFLRGNTLGLIVIFVTVSYGLIGFMDDYIKVIKKRSLGLRAYQKLIGQIIITTIFLYYIMQSGHTIGTYYSKVFVPFGQGMTIDMGLLYIPFVYIVMIGTVNGVNLTDGLDGLATGVTVLVCTFFMVMAAAYGSSTLPIIGAAVGSLLGFLLFNSYPAKVFMGDTGSLALGGFIASIAIILRMPLFLVIVGIIYVIESLSVIIQVIYFKKTGKRFFKMAPIHHTFEEYGWSETKISTLFYVITAIACLIGFLGAKYIF